MKMDRQAVREALEWYRQWNEAKEEERARLAASLTPQELWEQYKSLWNFFWTHHRPAAGWENEEKWEALTRYHQRLQTFESKRGEHGRPT